MKVLTLSEKMKNAKANFEGCATVQAVVRRYVEITAEPVRQSKLEIFVLQQYLNCGFDSAEDGKIPYTTQEVRELVQEALGKKPERSAAPGSELGAEAEFAYYEVEDDPKKASQPGAPIPFVTEPIALRQGDPYAVFTQMRGVGSRYGRAWNNNCGDSERFTAQGRFMADFEDDFPGNVPMEAYYPTYEIMNNQQLRTYFTWRTKVRSGSFEETSLAYVVLYIYELINNIGFTYCHEGMERLIQIWKQYGSRSSKIDNMLAVWVKDYYICNEFEETFQEIVTENRLESYYPELFMSDGISDRTMGLLHSLSAYRVENSRFFTPDRKRQIEGVFDRVVLDLIPLFELYGISLNNLILGAPEICGWWTPFTGAVYHSEAQPERTVVISTREKYFYERGHWTAQKPSGDTNIAGILFGYIMKCVEAQYRTLLNFKYKLSPKADTMRENLVRSGGNVWQVLNMTRDPWFDRIIGETAMLELNEKTRLQEHRAALELLAAAASEPYATFRAMRTEGAVPGAVQPEQLFYAQGQILTAVEDCVDLGELDSEDWGNAAPSFGQLDNRQLRLYCSWRTELRRGRIPPAPQYCFRLYLMELLNNVGVEGDWEAAEKMAWFLKNLPPDNRVLMKKTAESIKEYYICHPFSCTFWEFIQKLDIPEYYPNVGLEYTEQYDFALYRQLSSYRIERSRFYVNEVPHEISGCFQLVLERVEAYLKSRNVNLKKILSGEGEPYDGWRIYKGLICSVPEKPQFRERHLCSSESYKYMYGFWNCTKAPEKDGAGPALTGYLLKKTEALLRKRHGYRYKLTAETSMAVQRVKHYQRNLKEALLEPAFEDTIERAVRDYFYKPIHVEIDRGLLDRIRVEADQTLEKLAVDSEFQPEWQSESQPEPLGEPTAAVSEMQVSEVCQENEWTDFYRRLSEVQRQAVRILLTGGAQGAALSQLAKEAGMLYAVLLEGINEAALETAGDNAIETAEDQPYIYEEYLTQIEEVFGRQ